MKKNIFLLYKNKFEELKKDILNFLFYKKNYNEKEKILDFLVGLLNFEVFQTNHLL